VGKNFDAFALSFIAGASDDWQGGVPAGLEHFHKCS